MCLFRDFFPILPPPTSGYRDTKFYTYNKWAWWISYIVFRLFGIPWFSSVMWFTIAPMKAQSPMFPIVYYFAAMAVHYSLSLYWYAAHTVLLYVRACAGILSSL